MEDLIGSPAFLVAQFTAPAPQPSGEVVGQGGSHGLDMTAVDRTFTTLLRVRKLLHMLVRHHLPVCSMELTGPRSLVSVMKQVVQPPFSAES